MAMNTAKNLWAMTHLSQYIGLNVSIIDSLTNEMQLLELKLAQNDEHRLQTEITTLEQQELNNKQELDEQRSEEKVLNEKISELEKLFKNERKAYSYGILQSRN